MSLLNYFKINRKKNTASIAKERLQIIIAHERSHRNDKIDLNELKNRLIGVIAEYLNIEKDTVTVELEHDENRSVLELNVTLPDSM